MNTSNMQKFTFKMENENDELVVKGEIHGKTEIPFLDDLKFNAVIALLNSIDKQNFSETGNNHIFDNYLKEIEETINELKKYNQFQGNLNCREGL
ncbi:hypothetical protein ACFVR1_13890 [Psychrobacillus sp. NPDC058041]|uniref:hypothetical protein n=1 Tax=Psychrobacillus sp. NPDC058041 TaxID=3346310 RepID=UPI0036D8CB66